MRWACEYESKSGAIGLIIFSARDLNGAQIYFEEMITYYGHTNVFNLNELRKIVLKRFTVVVVEAQYITDQTTNY